MESPYQYVRELPLREITDLQRTLMEAYLELSYTKPRGSIRVKELCSVAYVARNSFYVHYESLEELREHIENHFIQKLLQLNEALVYEERKPEAMSFYSFLVQEPNYTFIQKWKDAIKLHLWERSRHKNLSSPHEALVLEMVAAEAIAAYTFCLSHPYEANEADIKKLLAYTLGMLE